MQNSYWQTASPAILTDSAGSQQPGSELDSLPRGSALLCETILTLSRKIKKSDDLALIRSDAAAIEDMAKELVNKIKEQMAA